MLYNNIISRVSFIQYGDFQGPVLTAMVSFIIFSFCTTLIYLKFAVTSLAAIPK